MAATLEDDTLKRIFIIENCDILIKILLKFIAKGQYLFR